MGRPLSSPALLQVLACMSVPLAAPTQNASKMRPFLHPEQLLCSVGIERSDVPSEFAKALCAVLRLSPLS